MSCLLTNGLTKDCNYFLAGLSDLWLANKSQVSGITDSNADAVLDTITMSGSSKFYKMEFDKNTGSFTNELAINNGSKSVSQSVSFSLSKKDATTIATADALALGTYVAICKDRNAKYFVLGRINGLEATVTTLNSGAAESDNAGLTVTLSGAQTEFAPEFTGTIPV